MITHMETKNILMADAEPTDEQLTMLMKEVLVEVKNRAYLAEKHFKEKLERQLIFVKEKYKPVG